ncbi:Hypothetical predicted protein [Pelobates cultripes]|uniref:Uncharacterized protein n=1 Tax=Pelobates cultripes TaxID=61616 RepID=A0AAD1W6Q2_PELCU|nr:Hypothetical predicted protein [Pelobates cultripes]
MVLATQLDLRFREIRQERFETNPLPNHHSQPAGATYTPIPTIDIEEPMQIGALNTMLTVTEKARRRAKGLCFYCATGPKRPPNQTNGTIMVPANPASVPEPQKEATVATFQSSASVSPKVSCSNTEDLSPDCVIASNGTVVRRQDLKVIEQALKARAASPSRLHCFLEE